MSVFDRLRDLFGDDQPQVDSAEQQRFATALLLAELARADYSVDVVEQRTIVELLTQRFALDHEAAARLLQRAQARAEGVVSLYDYVQTLNAQLDYRGRCDVIEMLWRVAYADGRLDKYEEHELRKIADLLYVEDSDFVRAKLKVAGERE